MSDALDWNAKTIAEFRANQGRVGGTFAGAPLVLVHHRGRKTGRQYVTPVMYLPHDAEPDTIYVFATKAGAPANPDWYYNLTAAGAGSVERGSQTYKVTVRELAGAERDRIYNEQARRYPGFAQYAPDRRNPHHPRPRTQAGLAHAPKTGRAGRGDLSGTRPPPRRAAHRRSAADTAGNAPDSINHAEPSKAPSLGSRGPRSNPGAVSLPRRSATSTSSVNSSAS